MSRRYDEPIEVTSALARTPRTSDPEAFIWRGRLFVVRAVLDRWQERRAWWREVGREDQVREQGGSADGEPTLVGAVVGVVGVGGVGGVGVGGVGVGVAGDPETGPGSGPEAGPGSGPGSGPEAGPGSGTGSGTGASRHERERQVWRVEASAGKAAGTGVFDLGADGVSAGGAPRWLLLRTHD